MPIFDAHTHLWSHDATRFPSIPWHLTGGGTLPSVDGTAEGLVDLMDDAGVSAALNVQVPWYGEDNRYHHDAVARFPGRIALLAVLDLDTPGAAARLERMHAEEGAQGLRIHLIERDRPEKLVAGAHDDVLETARRLDLPVQFLNRIQHFAAITDVVRRFDGLRVIVDHLCHPDPATAPDYPPWEPFFALADYPRSYVKISLQAELSKEPWPFRDLHGYTERVLERFTPSRCLWGSNYPLIPKTVTYAEVLAVVRDELPCLRGDDRDQVLGGTWQSLWSPAGEVAAGT